jgi:DNA primase
LSTSVVQLPEGEDADGLIRSQGATAIEGLIASARHWLEWRLDRLLSPLAAGGASPSLETLQTVEQAGQALIQQLPDGVLRRSAEQRLTVALQANDSHQELIAAATQPSTLAELALPTARQRLERRVVQLAIHAPQCLFMLTSLPLRDGACRAAFDWVQNTAMTVPPDQLPTALLRLVPKIGGATGALLAQAIAPAADVIQLLHSQPEAEFEALANALDPDPRLPEGLQ